MKKIAIVILVLLAVGCSAARQTVQKTDTSGFHLPQYTVTELKDSIKATNGVTLAIPMGYSYSMTEEWVNFTGSFATGLKSINLFNAIIKGQQVIMLLRPYDPYANGVSFDAFVITDLEKNMSQPNNPFPPEFVLDDYLVTLPKQKAQSLFGADKVQYIQIPADKMSFCNLKGDELSGLEDVRAKEYKNTRLYYFFKDGYKRFDILVLYKDKAAEDDAARLERFLSKVITY